MDVYTYRKDYLESVKSAAAAEAEGTVATFVKASLDNLVEAEIIPDYELCYYTGKAGKSGKKTCRIDAYAFDDYDCSMSLFIADYVGEESMEKLTRAEANVLFEKVHAFLEGSIFGKLKYEVEISTPAYDLIERINQLISTIRKFRFFIVTDKEMSENISSFPLGEINQITSEFNIWDMKRFCRILGVGDGHEPVEIDFTEFIPMGVPCIEAHDVSNDDFECYLCVLPGSVLANIYDRYGSRLLEGNVRSFLSTKVAVNKNIRATILGSEKHMFFSYNNGISATASDVVISTSEDRHHIISINNLQIVNGGQTTASLSNARFRDKADLSGIYVQMKLTVIHEHELAQKVIPQISRCSNSQNKVSDADFFSNHEFNIRMQQVSRRLYAPAVNGAQYETHWFFERVRGQYDQEQARMTKAAQDKFKLQNPKEQKITKTDLAKIRNSWRGFPHDVSRGAQKNFAAFAEYIVEEWNKDESRFNDLYFRQTVALAIIFQHVDRIVPKQNWYDKGYKANIVAYSMAFLHYLISKQYPAYVLNLKLIWDKQRLPESLEVELIRIARFVFEYITDEKRPIQNVTEWCKKKQCWVNLQTREFVLPHEIIESLIATQQERCDQRNGRQDQIVVQGIISQEDVVSYGQDYWERMLHWGKEKRLLSEIDISFILSATKINYGRIPSDKQAQRILNIRSRLLQEGYSER